MKLTHCLLTSQPDGHLLDVFLLVGGGISTLGIVDVQSLRVLRVVPVCCPELTDREGVVEGGVQLGYVEVFTNTEPDKDLLVVVECGPGSFEASKRGVLVSFKMSIVNKVKNSAHGTHSRWVRSASQHAKKDALHVLVLCSSPLCNKRYPFLEMLQHRMRWYHLEPPVYLVGTTFKTFSHPGHSMVLEDALVELVQEIRSDA